MNQEELSSDEENLPQRTIEHIINENNQKIVKDNFEVCCYCKKKHQEKDLPLSSKIFVAEVEFKKYLMLFSSQHIYRPNSFSEILKELGRCFQIFTPFCFSYIGLIH